MKKIYLLFVLLISSTVFSQKIQLKGIIQNAIDSTNLSGATILDLNSSVGILSDKQGKFSINTKVNDTVYISYVGFQSIKLKVTKDFSLANELNISLYPKREDLNAVVIKKHDLVGILEIDIKKVPRDKFNRIHIDGLTQTYEIKKSGKSYTTISALANPVDAVYNLFGKKPKTLKRLNELKGNENTRKILTQRLDREIILDYLEMDENQLVEILNECNYSNYWVKNATDLQIMEAVIECYEKHNALKNGKTNQ